MHTAAFQHLKLDFEYVAIRIPPEEFDEAMEHLRRMEYIGLNVTLPLKELAFEWTKLDTKQAKMAGAANTLLLRNRYGTNTDGDGFLDTLEQFGITQDVPVLLLGAGGSAKAVAKVLSNSGYQLGIYNRTKERAKKMIEDFDIQAELLNEPKLKDAGLIINATSASVHNKSVEIDWAAFSSETLAYDLAYSKENTPFLDQAESAGLKTTDGRHMLVAVGARSLEWWLEIDAPRDVMLSAIS